MLAGPYPRGLKLGTLNTEEVKKLAERNFLIHIIKFGIERSLSTGRPHEAFIPIFMNPNNLMEYSYYWEVEKGHLSAIVYELELR